MKVVCENPLYIDEVKDKVVHPVLQIITHDDMDGYMSAAVVYHMFNDAGMLNKARTRIGYYNYSNKIPTIDKDADIVFITDYSISNKAFMDELLEAYENNDQLIYWCDHHQTSIDLCTGKYAKLKDIPGIRSTEFCGAVLAYFFLNPGTTEKRLPYFLKLVDDFDCWKKKDRHSDNLNTYFNTFFYNNGIKSLSDPMSPIIGSFIRTPDKLKYRLQGMLEEGFMIESASKKINYANIRRNGWIGVLDKFPDIQMLCLNNDSKGSQLFSNLYNSKESPTGRYKYACAFQYDGTKFVVSIYSDPNASPNAQKICEAYGGGGHPGAAGFQTDTFFVKKVSDIPELYKYTKR